MDFFHGLQSGLETEGFKPPSVFYCVIDTCIIDQSIYSRSFKLLHNGTQELLYSCLFHCDLSTEMLPATFGVGGVNMQNG